jgi:aspartyl protease family protein
MGLFAELPPFNAELTLAAAFACMALVLVGGVVREGSALLGGLIRVVGNIGLIGSFSLTMLQLAHMAAPPSGLDDTDLAQVSGRETRIALGEDGHFWVRARVNGRPERFLVDTGATFTTISEQVAEEAGVDDSDTARRVVLHTANGAVQARLGRIGRLQVGNVLARDTRAVIAPALGGTNVLGMNFLSRLAGWRVESKVLVLTPKRADPGLDRPA